MVNCPECGTESTVIKSWTMASSKKGLKRSTSEIQIGIFQCPKCQFKFRAKVDSQAKPADSPDYLSLIEKLTEIKSGLNSNLNKLRENLKIIESERSGMILEFQELEDAEDKANDLELEVNELKDQLKSLKDLLGFKDDQNNP